MRPGGESGKLPALGTEVLPFTDPAECQPPHELWGWSPVAFPTTLGGRDRPIFQRSRLSLRGLRDLPKVRQSSEGWGKDPGSVRPQSPLSVL